jgi:hypothetical protein
VVVLDEEEAMWEKTRRRAGLSDDAGSSSLMTKSQRRNQLDEDLVRRMAQQGLRSTVVDAQ